MALRTILLALVAAASAAGDIFAAVKRDSMEDIKAALAADPSALDRTGPGGQSPLMHAVLMGKGAAAKYLLKRGADVSVAEKDGYTPMHGAGFQGRAAIAKLLIAHGLDPRDKHDDGYEPMHRAIWGREPRHTDTVRVFLEAGVPPSAKGPNDNAPLSMARGNAATKDLIRAALQEEKRKAKIERNNRKQRKQDL